MLKTNKYHLPRIIFMRSHFFLLILSFSLLLPITSTPNSYPLSYQSKQSIAITTMLAALASGTVGWLGFKLMVQNTPELSDKEKKEALDQGSTIAFVACATIGALMGAFYAYAYSPEKLLEDAQCRAVYLSSNRFFNTALNSEDPLKLQECFPADQYFVSSEVWYMLNRQLNTLNTIKNSLISVKNSEIAHLSAIATSLLNTSIQSEEKLRKWLSTFDAAHLKEQAARYSLEQWNIG